MHRSCLLFVLLLAASLPMRAHAALSCTYSPGLMDFGTLTSPVPQTNNTPNPTLSCTGGGSGTQNLCVTIGSGSGGGTIPRLMSSGANTLQYQIYFDSAHSIPWGDNSAGGFEGQQVAITLDGAGSGTLSLPLYGQIFAQSVASGTYASSGLAIAIKTKPGGSPCHSGSGGNVGTGILNTKVLIGASCTISASNIDFGTTSSLASAIPSSGSLSVNCTSGAAYTIAMNAGTSAGNTVAARKMSIGGTGAGVIGYQLYQSNSPLGTPWGDGTSGTFTELGTGTGSTQTIPVYAQIPVQATPATGSYFDTVTATITY